MVEYLFLKPLDVLYLRGNRLFGAAGDHSEALMPPWPSVASGAIRTRILAEHLSGQGITWKQFAENTTPKGPLGECLGTYENPGTFQVTHFSVGRINNGSAEFFLPLPADAAVQEGTPCAAQYLLPGRLGQGVRSSYPLDQLPILRITAPKKSVREICLNQAGVAAYVSGQDIGPTHTTKASDLWCSETRLGIAMSAVSRTADEGRIYTSTVVAMKEGAGFLVGIAGAQGFVPKSGLLRFGGDGRAVEIRPCSIAFPEPPWQALQESRRFKLMFQTPGLFPDGWRFPGFERRNGQWFWAWKSCEARLAAVALSRPEVISGWDLAKSRPKFALKSVPAGSVYWFEDLRGDVADLKPLLVDGIQVKQETMFRQRQAEGFNRVLIGAWPEKTGVSPQ